MSDTHLDRSEPDPGWEPSRMLVEATARALWRAEGLYEEHWERAKFVLAELAKKAQIREVGKP